MAERQLVEVWIAMNEGGQVRADTDPESAVNNLLESEGAMSMRLVCVQVWMAPPEAKTVEAHVPDDVDYVEVPAADKAKD